MTFYHSLINHRFVRSFVVAYRLPGLENIPKVNLADRKHSIKSTTFFKECSRVRTKSRVWCHHCRNTTSFGHHRSIWWPVRLWKQTRRLLNHGGVLSADGIGWVGRWFDELLAFYFDRRWKWTYCSIHPWRNTSHLKIIHCHRPSEQLRVCSLKYQVGSLFHYYNDFTHKNALFKEQNIAVFKTLKHIF